MFFFSQNNNQLPIDIRLNTSNGKPEWSARGADSWNPFNSSGALNMVALGFCGSQTYTGVYAQYFNADGTFDIGNTGNDENIIDNSDITYHSRFTGVNQWGTTYNIALYAKKDGYYYIGGSYTNLGSVVYKERNMLLASAGGGDYSWRLIIYLGDVNPLE